MQLWTVVLIIGAIIALGYLAQRLGWIDLSNKRSSGSQGGTIGILDEVFHPTRHEAQVELDRQTVLPAPAPTPAPGDDSKSIYTGKVRIDL